MRKESLFCTQCQGGDTCQKNKTPSVLHSKSWRGLEGCGCDRARFVIKWGGKAPCRIGHNELEEGEKRSILVKFIEQFKDLMIIILVAAAILSVVTSGGEDIADAIIILSRGYHQRCLRCLPRREKQKKPLKPSSLCPVQLLAFFVMGIWRRLTLKNWYQEISLPRSRWRGASRPTFARSQLLLKLKKQLWQVSLYQSKRLDSRACCRCWYWWPCQYGLPKLKCDLWSWYWCCCQYRYVHWSWSHRWHAPRCGWDGYALKQNLNNLSKVLTYIFWLLPLLLFVVGVFIQGENPLGELLTSGCACRCAIQKGFLLS